ncbi:MAG: TraB/GumN family protein [Hellea sp.]|nr:TraB/GumN family protein [Hellea sp.]
MRLALKTAFTTVLIATLAMTAACKKSGIVETSSLELFDMERIDQAFAKAASTQGDGDPAMWKMADEDTTIYIYGTFHLLPETAKWQTAEFKAALDSADTVYFEIDMSDENQIAMSQKLMAEAMFSDGKSLEDVMTSAQYEKFTTLASELGLPAQSMSSMKPWFVGLQAQIMAVMKAGYDPTKGVEMVIMESVESDGKKIGSLETVEDQIEALSGGTMEEQVASLLFSLESSKRIAEMTDLVMQEWADGDVAGLGAMMGDPAMFGTEEAYNALLTNRNRNWIPEIESILDAPGVKFVAVGAGHLAGPDSVILMLEGKGHIVEVVQ